MSLIDKLNAYVPTKEELTNKRGLKWLMPILNKHQLWLIKRRSVANALLVGLFSAFTPWPMQMIQAALMSLLFNANVPIAIAVVWITNPITMGPIFYGAYKVGALLTGFDGDFPEFNLSFTWMINSLTLIWKPFLLGCFLCGTILGILSWFLCHLWWYQKTQKKRRKKQLTRPLH